MNNQGSMNVTVVLHIGIGSFEQGFPVRAEIFNDGRLIKRKTDFANLPPFPNTPQLYRDWQDLYGKMGKIRGIGIPPQTTNHSITEECKLAAKELERYLKAKPSGWFNHSSFQHLRDWIWAQALVQQDQSVPVFFDLETGQDEQNVILKRLPWHLWDLFTEHKNTEVALYGQVAPPIQSLSQPVKILAIFGSGEGGLELKEDIKALEGLESFGANVKSEREPSRERLHNLFNESWDILFFAGHSSSDENLSSGHLLVGKGRQYSLDNIRVDLKTAVDKGLKMAIFNSCDGLGIADFLMNLGVPTVIVFREPVPDLVARIFLKKFLENFSGGKPLYRSVREARDGLHWLESADPSYPCASWLPVIYQNPSQPELVWPPVVDPPKPPEIVTPWWKRRYALAAIGLVLLGTVGYVLWLALQAGHEYGSSLKLLNYSSLGAKSLIDGGTLAGTENSREGCRNIEEKKVGTQAFANEKYSEAMTHFGTFLQSCSSDPETQIYYNNAKALSETSSTLLSGQDKTLRVAVIVPIASDNGVATGARADVAQEMLRGVAIAQYKINKEGAINGKPLLIQIVDDDKPGNQDLSERIPEVGSKLAADPAILAVVGPNDSKTTQSLGQAISGSELTVISPTSTAARKSSNNSSSPTLNLNILRTATTDAIAAQKLVEDMRQAGRTKVTVIYDEKHLYSKSLKEEFQKASSRGQLQVSLCNLADGNTNPDGCLRPGDSNALLWIPSPEAINRAIPFIINNNNRPPVWAGDSAYGRSVLMQLGTTAQGMKIFVPWAKEASSNSAPLEAFDINWLNAGINWRTAMAYDATQAIAQGLKLMGNVPKREGLREKLLSPGFKADGILGNGTVQFTSDGKANDLVGVGDRKPDNRLGVMVKVKCEPDCRYFQSN